MTEKKDGRAGMAARWLLAAASVALLSGVVACKSSHARVHESPSASRVSGAVGAVSPGGSGLDGSGPGIDLNCTYDALQNPTESFHYVYKKVSDYPVDEEADLTPQTIDGSFTNSSGTHAVHGVHSDQQSWSQAMAGMTAISGMSSTVALVNHGSAMVKEETKNVNGYDTTRYSIDTTRGDAADQGLFKITLGDGGFEKGEAWVTAKACPVKLSLDSEMHLRNGNVDKQHYEIAMVKK